MPSAVEQQQFDRQARLDARTNMASPLRFLLYCIYNPLFRREAFKKQGMRLGVR
jgi:hypothetical protein